MKYIPLIEYQEEHINDSLKKSLQGYLENSKDEFLQNIFTFTSKGIKARNYVGVFRYKNYQFEILPKLLNKEEIEKEDDKDKEIILKNLLYMLSLTKKLDIKESEIAKISKSKNPFLEILIKIYANSLFECLKRFVPKNYVTEEDNLNFLKGKLLFSKHIIKNSVNQAKFYCQYDEFSENNLLNQLFYYVSRLLYFVSNDNENKRILKFITDFFCDIDFKKINIYKIKNLKLTRNQTAFKKPFDLAKMFLENSSVDMNQHKIKTISLLWDMNILFEEFIFEFIKRNKEKIYKEINEINYQKGKRLLYCDETKQYYGNTFVDIFLKLNNEKIIVDTKYKINDGKIGEFSNSDIFQMITYETIHNSQNAILIYPTVNKETEIIHKYILCKDNYEDNNKDNKHHISTATIYLGYNLQENKETLISRLSDILKSIKN
ncbi:McrC family protein [Candidatus Ruminimicrobium bovinum]|uniref:McrC family protein n=1 Tax=Candidatus Ruminimicrobium bovinum TaxID=3242779 RepID=UPI0039B8FD6C